MVFNRRAGHWVALLFSAALLADLTHAQLSADNSRVYAPDTFVVAPERNTLTIELRLNSGDLADPQPQSYMPTLAFQSLDPPFLMNFLPATLTRVGSTANYTIDWTMPYMPFQFTFNALLGDFAMTGQSGSADSYEKIGGGSITLNGEASLSPVLSTCEVRGGSFFALHFDNPTDRALEALQDLSPAEACDSLLAPSTLALLGDGPRECYFESQTTLAVSFPEANGAGFAPGVSAGVQGDVIRSADGSAIVDSALVLCPAPSAINPRIQGPAGSQVANNRWRAPLPCSDESMILTVVGDFPLNTVVWTLAQDVGPAPDSDLVDLVAAQGTETLVIPPNNLPAASGATDETFRLTATVRDDFDNEEIAQARIVLSPAGGGAASVGVSWTVLSGRLPGQPRVARCDAVAPACVLAAGGSVYVDGFTGATPPDSVSPPLSDAPSSILVFWDPDNGSWDPAGCRACADLSGGQVCNTAVLNVTVDTAGLVPTILPEAPVHTMTPEKTKTFHAAMPDGSTLIPNSVAFDSYLRKRPGRVRDGTLPSARWTHVLVSHGDAGFSVSVEATMNANATGDYDICMSFSPGGETCSPIRVVGAVADTTACEPNTALGVSADMRWVDTGFLESSYLELRTTVGVCSPGGAGDVPDDIGQQLAESLEFEFALLLQEEDFEASQLYQNPTELDSAPNGREIPKPPPRLMKRIDAASPLLYQGNPGTTAVTFVDRVYFPAQIDCRGNFYDWCDANDKFLRAVISDPSRPEIQFWGDVEVPSTPEYTAELVLSPATTTIGDFMEFRVEISGVAAATASASTFEKEEWSVAIEALLHDAEGKLLARVPHGSVSGVSAYDLNLRTRVQLPSPPVGSSLTWRATTKGVRFHKRIDQSTPLLAGVVNPNPGGVIEAMQDAERAGSLDDSAQVLADVAACLRLGNCPLDTDEDKEVFRVFLDGHGLATGRRRLTPISAGGDGGPVPGLAPLVKASIDAASAVAGSGTEDSELCSDAADLLVDTVNQNLAGLVENGDDNDLGVVLDTFARIGSCKELAKCDEFSFNGGGSVVRERIHESQLYMLARNGGGLLCGETDHFFVDPDSDGDTIEDTVACRDAQRGNSSIACPIPTGSLGAGVKGIAMLQICPELDGEARADVNSTFSGPGGAGFRLGMDNPVFVSASGASQNVLYDSVNPPGGSSGSGVGGQGLDPAQTLLLAGMVNEGEDGDVTDEDFGGLEPECRDSKCDGHGHVTVLKIAAGGGDGDDEDGDADKIHFFTVTGFGSDPGQNERAANTTIRGLCGNFDDDDNDCLHDDTGEPVTPVALFFRAPGLPANNATHTNRVDMASLNRDTGEWELGGAVCYNFGEEVPDGLRRWAESKGVVAGRTETYTVCLCTHLSEYTPVNVVEILEIQATWLWTRYLIPTLVGVALVAILTVSSIQCRSTHKDEDELPVAQA